MILFAQSLHKAIRLWCLSFIQFPLKLDLIMWIRPKKRFPSFFGSLTFTSSRGLCDGISKPVANKRLKNISGIKIIHIKDENAFENANYIGHFVWGEKRVLCSKRYGKPPSVASYYIETVYKFKGEVYIHTLRNGSYLLWFQVITP